MTSLPRSVIALLLASSLPLFAGTPSGKSAKQVIQPEPPTANPWRFSAGYQWRQIGSVDWSTGSAASTWSLPWLVGHNRRSGGGSPTLPPAGVGDHFYDDGYVLQDAGTPFFGDTQFWGYNDASQITGVDVLSFHSNLSSSQSRTVASSSSSLQDASWSDDLAGSGWFANVESPLLFTSLFKDGGFGFSMIGGYSFATDSTSRTTGGVFTAAQRSTTTTSGTTGSLTDVYDTTGIFVPSAPYQGTFDGPGPLINNAPLSRTMTGGTGSRTTGTSSRTALFSSDVTESLDIDLHTISLGPKFSLEIERVRFGLGLGFALNIADWDASTSETLQVSRNGGSPRVLKRWESHASDNEVVPGFYLEANAEVQVTQHVSLFAGGRYDWAGSVHGDVGPSSFSLDLGGWTAMGGITFHF